MKKMRRGEPSGAPRPDELRKWLARVERKVDIIIKSLGKSQEPKARAVEGIDGLDVMALLSLPDHLRKTAMAVIRIGEAMADEVARETGRARAIESAYLNQLVRIGHMKRSRRGKRVYFSAAEGLAKGGS